jgi:predicted GIY-YIG superfamily endonuclease
MVNIYILQLEDNKYYIGKTTQPEIRLVSHFNSDGSSWT